VTLFSLFEKTKKEQYIIGLTNAKTKKQLMKYLNQITPSVIMNKEGTIQMCNERFELLVSEKFG